MSAASQVPGAHAPCVPTRPARRHSRDNRIGRGIRRRLIEEEVRISLRCTIQLYRDSDSHSSGSENLPLPDNSEAHSGDLTFYNPGLGACGETSTDGDDIVSLSYKIWDEVQTGSDPNQVVLCGMKIRARRFNEDVNAERSVDLTVVDRCKWAMRVVLES